ncbi:MAG: histidine kinase, partial [Candidatus Marinimicrobia bacterium]|nr:histidine kinase [Candidatus Neomarinimicrobiota bacterium]
MSTLQRNVVLIHVISYTVFNPFLASLNAQFPPTRFDQISIEQGLSQSSVTCMIQDHKGFMWFGTQDGLNKYDGYRFTVYKHTPEDSNSLSSNYIRSLYLDSDENGNVLWIGTWGGGLNKLNLNTGIFSHYKHNPENPKSLSNDYIKSIYVDRTGDLWIGTDGGGLNKLDWETGTFYYYKHDPHNPNSLSNDYVNSIHS